MRQMPFSIWMDPENKLHDIDRPLQIHTVTIILHLKLHCLSFQHFPQIRYQMIRVKHHSGITQCRFSLASSFFSLSTSFSLKNGLNPKL